MRKFLVIIFCSLFSFNSFSSHLMGGEITWECLKSGPDAGKYIFTMKVYRDCSGISVSTITQVIQVWNHPTVTGIDVDFILQQDVSPLCDPSSSGILNLTALLVIQVLLKNIFFNRNLFLFLGFLQLLVGNLHGITVVETLQLLMF